ncbi:peptidoglycan hydrolase-like protein with peptidoglycan-binding domain [Sphingomonas sp. PP-CE-3G-477]|uniref:BPSL0067 family protein n=1 Tax=Sphingomonas sp. PP-CE-3G-477 TaxID=2135660 RepID=UPI000D367FB6|nr:BPSL0067 family protein [Sphingomonas sp. PP-CE-3G-477]PTQ65178.1 peptidoglycan hydrolase-like protein with peptidoglycan-binding domain [Sphingomonas sp. PP-CE-3G-477]
MATRLARKGDHGAIVREIQGNLVRAGHPVKTDGLFGSETDAAVRAFQKEHKLPVDGVVGPGTLAVLHRRPPQPKPPGQDGFDPAAFGAWLAKLPGEIYDAILPDKPTVAASRPVARPETRPETRKAPDRPTRATGKPVVSPAQNTKHRRISFPGYEGRGFVLQDFEKYENYAIKLLNGYSVAPWDPRNLIKNECAQFVQFFGVPRTREWRAGPQVCFLEQSDIPSGTVVATLRDNMYHNDYSGRSHVGIYLRHDPFGTKGGGVLLLDQFNKNPIKRRLKRYDGDAGRAKPIRATGRRYNWSADGEEYFVLLV